MKVSALKRRVQPAVLGATALAMSGGLILASTGVAFATTPGWEPDPTATGMISLYNATGTPVTGGSTTTNPIAAFSIGSHPGLSTDTKATMYFCTPQASVAPTNWSCTQMSLSTTYSPSSSTLPPNLASTNGSNNPLPIETGSSSDKSIAGSIASVGANTLTTTGYQNLYEIRLVTSGTGHAADPTQSYNAVDVQVNCATSACNGSNDTWSAVYPSANTTSIAVTTNPTSPVSTTTNPEPVTLTATITPGNAVPTGWNGPAGTVQFFDAGVQVGATQVQSGASPYTASVSVSETNPSSHTFTVTYAPYGGAGYTGSTSPSVTWTVSPPPDGTSTSLSVNQDGKTGDPVTMTSTVTDTSVSPNTTLCVGSVTFFDNGSTTLGTASSAGSPCTYTLTLTSGFASPGSHSIVATFNAPSGYTTSSSAPQAFSQTVGSSTYCPATTNVGQPNTCTDVQNVQATVPIGTLSITTPYTPTNPLNLGTLALDPNDTEFTGNAPFTGINVTDTRSGAMPWTVNVLGQPLSDGSGHANGTINPEDLGLTNITVVPVSGNGFNTASTNLTTFANPAAYPPVSPGDAGSLGLGGLTPHEVAHALVGTGSVGFNGTLVLNAPTSTEAGLFKGTVTFTIVGS